jgi:glycosyltransferase involved in cell wall biosynthesis
VEVDHVPAGPPEPVAKDDLLPHMDAFARGLRRAWSDEPPDLVHAHFWMSGRAALWARDRARPHVPVVQTFHALGVVKRRHQGARDTSHPIRQGAERDLLRSVDRVIATCSDEVFELVRLGADGRRVGVVPCGVDLGLFGPGGRREERRPGERRIVTVGRLVERKGLADVVAALAEVPRTELHMAGGPERAALGHDPEARRLAALAREHGVADRVHLRGRVDRTELPALLRSADALVSVPWYEPFGIVPLEAMACGVPVVASAVGGQIDSVVHGVTGLHVAPRDPGALAHALRGLLDDPERRAALGAGGARRARERYGWDRVAQATHEAYRALVAAGGRRRREVLA